MFYAEYPPSGGSGGVTSLNDLTGALTLAEGSGITITDNGTDTITIAVTANTFANVFLSNLQSPTAINQDLLPDVNVTRSIGEAGNGWQFGYIGQLNDALGSASIDPFGRSLFDSSGIISIDWESHLLQDIDEVGSLDYAGRTLLSPNGSTIFSWANNTQLTASQLLSMGSHRISNVSNPLANQDAATKLYVDNADALAANKTLSNLTSPTAINQNLIPGTTNTLDIGDGTHLLHTIFMGAGGFGYTLNKNLEQRAQIHPALSSPSGVTDIPGILGFGVSSIGYPILVATGNESTANANATGNLYLETGNKSAGTGDSGSIRLQTGTSAGGARGTINIIDDSLAGASNGYVWTLADQTTGAGSWQASGGGGGGANVTLSNLTDPTAINANLTFDGGFDAAVVTSDIDSDDSASIAVRSGNTTTSGNSGLVGIASGDAAGASGRLNLNTGTADAGASGRVTIQSGIGDTTSGNIIIRSGSSTGTDSNTGNVTINSGGLGVGAGSTGALTLLTGSADITTGAGSTSGGITIQTGDAAGIVAAINIQGGAGTDTTGGGINISGGNGGGGGGAIAITSGAATVTDVGGANVTIITGSATGGGSSGSASITTGTSVDGSSGGLTLLSGGVSGSANSGDLYIASGAPTDGTSGGINISTGTPSGTGSSGQLVMTTGQSTATGTGAIFIVSGDSVGSNSGDINIGTGSGAVRGIISLSALMLKLPSGSSDPTGVAGGVYYNTGSNTIRWYDGTTWAAVSAIPSEAALGTLTWAGGVAPSGTISKTYRSITAGRQITVLAKITATVAGTAVTSVSFPLPAGLPNPVTWATQESGGLISPGTGSIMTTIGGVVSGSSGIYDDGAGGYVIKIFDTAAINATDAFCSLTYIY